jgi:hypothetical protein
VVCPPAGPAAAENPALQSTWPLVTAT